LRSEDFNNDRKDAGELGSGHSVTALYEIIPVGVESEFYKVDKLKYQTNKATPEAQQSDELMTVKFRYKEPAEEVSKLMIHTLVDKQIPFVRASENFRWSASVAAFGMLMRESEYVNNFSYEQALVLAQAARGADPEGYRIECIQMMKSFGALARN
jgi:Ca-activated chloride channel homolog